MKKGVSPFAALTCQEKHLKWLEYQNMRLPYMKTAVDREPINPADNAAAEKPAQKSKAEKRKDPSPPHGERGSTAEKKAERTEPRPTPPSPLSVPWAGGDMRPRHRQYDAVIARMKQAEMRTRNYTSVN